MNCATIRLFSYAACVWTAEYNLYTDFIRSFRLCILLDMISVIWTLLILTFLWMRLNLTQLETLWFAFEVPVTCKFLYLMRCQWTTKRESVKKKRYNCYCQFKVDLNLQKIISQASLCNENNLIRVYILGNWILIHHS